MFLEKATILRFYSTLLFDASISRLYSYSTRHKLFFLTHSTQSCADYFGYFLCLSITIGKAEKTPEKSSKNEYTIPRSEAIVHREKHAQLLLTSGIKVGTKLGAIEAKNNFFSFSLFGRNAPQPIRKLQASGMPSLCSGHQER